jgi:hypothetical protein
MYCKKTLKKAIEIAKGRADVDPASEYWSGFQDAAQTIENMLNELLKEAKRNEQAKTANSNVRRSTASKNRIASRGPRKARKGKR